jgi:glutathione S-transferase
VKFEIAGAGAGGDRAAVTGDVAILLYLDARHPRKKGGEAETARVYTRFCAAVALGHKWKALWADGGRARVAAAAERRDLMRAIFRSSDMGTFDDWLSESLGRLAGSPPSPSSPSPSSLSPSHSPPFSSSETGEVFLAGGAEPSIADYAFWPVVQDMTEEWRRAGGGFEETWVERGRYTALEKYYVDFSGRRSVVGVFGERVGALLAAAPEGKKKGQGGVGGGGGGGGGDGDGGDGDGGDGDSRGGDTGTVVEKQEPVGVGKGEL